MIRSLPLQICLLLVLGLGLAEGMEPLPSPPPLPQLKVESFSIQELQSGTRDAELRDILATTGILSVRVPRRNENNTRDQSLLDGFCQLEVKDKDEKSRTPGTIDMNRNRNMNMKAIKGGDEYLLSDGLTVRRTIATATMGLHSPLPLPEDDIVQQYSNSMDTVLNTPARVEFKAKEFVNDMERARDLVSQAASDAFIPALQRLIDAHHRQYHHTDTDTDTDDQNQNVSMSLMKKKNGQSYSTISSIVNDAVNLEHFHMYSKKEPTATAMVDSDDNKDPSLNTRARTRTLEWHTDGGLFLAFLPAKLCERAGKDTSFHVRVPSTSSYASTTNSNVIPEAGEYQAVFAPNTPKETTVVIMLGAGAEHWVNTSTSSASDNDNDRAPSPSLPLRATTHSVYMKPGQTRVWYGMMHLVPGDAIVQTKPYPMTFAELKKTSTGTRTRTASGSGSSSSSSRNGYHGHYNGRRYGDDTSNPKDSIIVGCGTDDIESDNEDAINPVDIIQNRDQEHHYTPYRRRLQHVGGPEDCDNSGSYYCWLSCLPEDKASSGDATTEEHLSAGESLYCLDPSILAQTGNLAKAVEECADSRSGEAGGVMNEACGNYWHRTEVGVQSYLEGTTVPPTNNDTGATTTFEEQYCYGATGMYMQGFEWEGTTCVIYLFSSWVLSTRAAFAAACFGTIIFGIVVEFIIRQRRTILGRMERGMTKIMTSAALYGVQLTLGYLLMLVVMTYSGPLVISVVVGLVIGHLIWNWKDVVGENGSGEIVLDGSTPCCQNIIEEEKNKVVEEKCENTNLKEKEGTCCEVSYGSDEEKC